MGDPKVEEEEQRDFLVGKLALDQNLITAEQLREALAEQARGVTRGRARPRPLAVILAAKNFISNDQMLRLLQAERARASNDPSRRQGERRLGDILVERGLIGDEQLAECLAEQGRALAEGREVKGLGEILVRKGFIRPEAIAQALALQDKTILACSACGKRYNVRGFDPSKAYRCTACRAPLEALTEIDHVRADREDAPLADSPAPKAPASPPAPAKQASPPIQTLGKYSIIRELGRGGMGVVYEALDTSLNRRVALKLMLSRNADPQEEERFVREARLSARIPKHPSIVGVYEAGVFDGRYGIAMELVDGQSMLQWRKKGSITVRQQAKLLRDVALAVHHAHEHGTLHRDLKPQNILVGPRHHPYVTDFGLAKRTEHDASASLTVAGLALGTPTYMSPEQAQGSKKIDRRTDVYSMGVMLYEILTGRPPFRGSSPMDIILKHLKEPVVPPSQAVKAGSASPVDRSIEAICLRALAKKPGERYPTAKAFADDLDRWLKGEEVRVRRPARPLAKPWVLGAAAAAVLVAILAVALSTRPSSSKELARARERLKARDSEQARRVLEAVLRKDRGNAEARALLEQADLLERQWAAEAELEAARRELEELRRRARAGDSGNDVQRQIEVLADRARRAEERVQRSQGGPTAPAPAAVPPPPPPPPPAPPPAPPPPPPAPAVGEARRSAWALAAAWDFASAAQALEELAGKGDAAALRADLELVGRAAPVPSGALAVAAKWARGQNLELAYFDAAGQRAAARGVVHAVDSHRVELSLDSAYVTIPLGELAARTLGELYRARPSGNPERDADAAAALCRLEDLIEESGPAAPAETDARRHFYSAESDYFDPARTADAVQAYRALLRDHAGTAFVRRNRPAIAARAEGGAPRELLLLAAELAASPGFRLGRHNRMESCLIAQQEGEPSHVQIEFSGFASTEPRLWVYAGGCCLEVFSFQVQATELKGPHPKNPKEIVFMEPGSEFAIPAKLPVLALKKLHAQHTGPKEPDRWEWVSIPLPNFSSEGRKTVRLVTAQKGFSVAYAFLSTQRTTPPREAELREIERRRSEAAGYSSARSRPEGTVLREWWTSVPGKRVEDLLRHPDFPARPSGEALEPAFQAPVNWGDRYGTRMRGYVHPPATGDYVFWICGDDHSELWLSTDETPAHRTRIAFVLEWAPPGDWTKFPSQQSRSVPLRAGRRYYIEAVQKEEAGGDHLFVGWRLPDGTDERPIPGARLSPFRK
jgi:predicted Ser/Thr protein kinase